MALSPWLEQERTINGVRFRFFPAGHVLGAVMIRVEIAGVAVLYTGDYNCIEDRHLPKAVPPIDRPPEVVIAESTFGVRVS